MPVYLAFKPGRGSSTIIPRPAAIATCQAGLPQKSSVPGVFRFPGCDADWYPAAVRRGHPNPIC